MRMLYKLKFAFRPEIFRRAILVSFVVGLILTLINQYEQIALFDFSHLVWWKVILTFLVPYCVSTYSSIWSSVTFIPGDVSVESVELECSKCPDFKVVVKKGDVIPECPNCPGLKVWQVSKRLPDTEGSEKSLESKANFVLHNPSPVLRVNEGGVIVAVNPSAEKLIASQLLGGKIVDYLEVFKEVDFESLILREDCVTVYQKVGGSNFQFEVTGIEKEGVIHIYGSDVSELEMYREKLQALSYFPQLNPAPVIRFDLNGVILSANNAANHLYESLLEGQMIQNIFGADLDIKQIISENKIVQLKKKVGNQILNFTIKGIQSLGVCQSYGADVTEVEASREAMKSFALFAELNPEPVVRFNADGIIQDANPAANSLFSMPSIVGYSVLKLMDELGVVSLSKCIQGDELHVLQQSIDNRVYRFIIRGIKELEICQAYGSDVTEVEASRKAMKSFALFAELNPEPVMRFDVNGLIKDANPAANSAFSKSTIVGLCSLDLIYEMDSINISSCIANDELHVLQQNVEDRIYRFIIRGVNELGICQAYGSDVTERVKAEKLVKEQAMKITSSIEVAKRIQKAIQPCEKVMVATLKDYFVLNLPKDIVSGDFYWFKELKDQVFIVVADCTGHGVPGGFMSMLGSSMLNQMVQGNDSKNAAEVLEFLRDKIKLNLRQTADSDSCEGMDGACCIIDKKEKQLQYAGAYNPLWLMRDDKFREYKADRMPVGVYVKDNEPFTNHVIDYRKGDSIYMFSDGYADQFGGNIDKKFGKKRMTEVVVSNSNLPMVEQCSVLSEAFLDWKGETDQTDDVMMLGIRL